MTRKVLLSLFVSIVVVHVQTISLETEKKEIERVLEKQIAGWNNGSIEQFMTGYAETDSVRFASGGTVTLGWNAMLARYKKEYPDSAAMGRLQFSEIAISFLAPNVAMVFGKWSLTRANDAPWGLFTLIFQKSIHGWRIIHDHTSSNK